MARNLNLQIIAALEKRDLKAIKEWDFQVAVGKYAEDRCWSVHYNKQSGYMGPSGKWLATSTGGWPDMFMLRNGKVVVAELKRDIGGKAGNPTEEQQAWLTGLAEVEGIETYHWRPRDASTIIEVLK